MERAQKKLKLDAMVVQQGRLQDKDKVRSSPSSVVVVFDAHACFFDAAEHNHPPTSPSQSPNKTNPYRRR